MSKIRFAGLFRALFGPFIQRRPGAMVPSVRGCCALILDARRLWVKQIRVQVKGGNALHSRVNVLFFLYYTVENGTKSPVFCSKCPVFYLGVDRGNADINRQKCALLFVRSTS